MKYIGSKRTVANYLLPRILAGRKSNQYYIEPFVGGCNMIDKVKGLRIGNDINPLLIAMWKALQNGWVPPNNVSEYTYYDVKNNQTSHPPELVCFIGYLCSFGGKWWGGYAWNTRGRNYAEEGYNNLMKQAPLIKGIEFTCMDYRQLDIPPKSIIYCDPPYEDTTGYDRYFNHARFWKWARDKSREGHRVYVSEYESPPDFICVRQIERPITMDKNIKQTSTERLFMYRGA